MDTQRWSFLKDGDTSFGMFYPLHYTLAGYPDDAAARAGADLLRDSGFAARNVHVVAGQSLIDEIEGIERDSTWLDRLQAKISEFIGTETYFIDQDLTLAREGGSFVLAYTPDEDSAERAASALRRTGPQYARRYLDMAIDRVIEPASTHFTRPRH